jgi:hypothetical protein
VVRFFEGPIDAPGEDDIWREQDGRTLLLKTKEFGQWLTQQLKHQQSSAIPPVETKEGHAVDAHTAAALTTRDTLFDDVSYGRMTPEEAEAAAKKHGLKPLQEIPDPALFNPMEEPTWTLAMAVAWIVWRTPETVRENWDDYRLECWDWHWHRRRLAINGGMEWEDSEGWELRQRGNATLSRLSLYEAYSDTLEAESRKLVSVKSAREALWRRLAEGALAATAIAVSSQKPVQVPAHEWSYLTATADKNLADELRYAQTLMTVEYREVKFRREDIFRLWPPITRSNEPSAVSWIEFEDAAKRKLTVHEIISYAVRELWDGQVPTDYLKKERDNQIMGWCRDNGMRPPSERSLRSYFNS